MLRRALASLVPCLIFGAVAAHADAPVVAVFDIQDRTGKFQPAALDQLTDYLATQVAEGGTFTVVPRTQVKAALDAQKSESYKQCYDDTCQIEIGRELAAQKSLLTQIVQIGTQCAVTGTLFDLRKGASERAASRKTTCDQDALVTALEGVAETLREHARAGGAVAGAVPAPAPGPAPAAAEGAPAAGEPVLAQAPDTAPAGAASDDGLTSSPVFWVIVIGTVVAVGVGVGVAVAVSSTNADLASAGASGALIRF